MAHWHGRRRVARAAAALSGVAGAICWLAAFGLSAQTATPSYTVEQAERGQASYEHSCQACHGSTLDNGDFGGAPLRGSWFRTHWGSTDVGALFSYVKAAMPPDNPGSLNDSTFADILAFILRGNGYPPGAQELPSDPEALRQMPLRR
jgi:mono/diheme cytochrome c family protein